MYSYNYDLHIHSCLSPCGSQEMTPNNIVNMAKVCGVNILALTDHNRSLNCEAVSSLCAEAGIVFVPGMELCTAEEIHMVCLFPDLKSCESFSKYVGKNKNLIKNKPDIFGHQLHMDRDDNIIGEVDHSLVFSTNISVDSVSSLVNKYGGITFPAHCDRSSLSIISSFGFIPRELTFDFLEVENKNNVDYVLSKYNGENSPKILFNSDAHYLKDIYIKNSVLKTKSKIITAADVVSCLKGETN